MKTMIGLYFIADPDGYWLEILLKTGNKQKAVHKEQMLSVTAFLSVTVSREIAHRSVW